MKFYIYKMIHVPSGRVYIGQHKLPKNKTPENDGYYGSGKIWKRIYNKYKDECVKVVIGFADSKTEIDELEKKYITHYKNVYGEFCVNVAPGGEGFCCGDEHPNFGKHLSEEQRKKISEAQKGKKNHFFGKHHTEETRKKMCECRKGERHPNFGKHHTEETRKKMSEAKKGKHPSAETRRKLSESHSGEKNHNFGKYRTEETRKKISEAVKAYFKNRKEHI